MIAEPLLPEEDDPLDEPLLDGPEELPDELLPDEDDEASELEDDPPPLEDEPLPLDEERRTNGLPDELLTPLEDEPMPDDPDDDDSQHPRPSISTSHLQLSA